MPKVNININADKKDFRDKFADDLAHYQSVIDNAGATAKQKSEARRQKRQLRALRQLIRG